MNRLVVLILAATTLEAQSPTALTIVAPAAPGGGWDQLARTMQRVLEAEGIVPRVQVENIPGAAGTVGLARFVSGRRRDPAALLVTGLVMVGGVVQNASPVTLNDATPIARLVGEYEAVAVPRGSPYRTLGDLLSAFRGNPGAISWGGGSAGGTDQILVDLIARASGVDPRRVNYVAFSGGGEAKTALLGAQVSAGVSGLGEFADLARAGQVRVLAVSAPERVDGWAAPTLREAGVDVVLSNWRGVLAPPGLRPLQRASLERVVSDMVRSPSWREEIRRRGWEDAWLGGEAFGRFADAESHRVEGLVALRLGTASAARDSPLRVPLWLTLALVV
ncbi:MAG: tripartite tricarboxylate transporter substrate binding protein, partial [Gemmatimonadaceae bacterium]